MKTILLGGGTGLIGARLAQLLKARGDEVRILSRHPEKVDDYKSFGWDAKAMTIDSAAIAGVTHVVNLAGAGIADKRWTPERKELIIASRVNTTRLLSELIQQGGSEVEAYISASAIGYYGDSGEVWVGEDAPPGSGFLSESTLAWEAAVAALADATGVRTCALRTGIVLTSAGGALEKMLQPTRIGVSGYFGNGKQWYSWIHLDDICGIYLAAIDDAAYSGPVNAVAPHPVSNKQLARVIAAAVAHPVVTLPVPTFGLRLVLGEMSHTILDSCRVSSEKLVEELGYVFEWEEVEGLPVAGF